MTKKSRGNFNCPKCNQRANRIGGAAKHNGLARRACRNPACGFEFTTKFDGETETFDREYTPGPTSKRRRRDKENGLYGYEKNHPKRVLKLAPHHYLVGLVRRFPSRLFDEGETGFTLLRCPETGRAVASKRKDDKPNEISYVLG